jgi:hypothetical protein
VEKKIDAVRRVVHNVTLGGGRSLGVPAVSNLTN